MTRGFTWQPTAVLRLWIHFQPGPGSTFSSGHITRQENPLNCIQQVFIALTDYKAKSETIRVTDRVSEPTFSRIEMSPA